MENDSQVTWSNIRHQKLGRVTLAGYVRKGAGAGWDRMRILGSYALVYLHKGKGLYEDGAGAKKLLQAGDLIIVYPDLPHRYGPRPDSSDSWNEFYVVFDGPIFDLWHVEKLLSETVVHLEPPDYWLPRLTHTVENKTPLEAMLAVQEFLVQMTQSAQANSLAASWLRRAQALLESFTLANQIDLIAVANAMGETYETFRKKFRHLAGRPPGRYASERVIARACSMLRSHAQSLTTVARDCGYCDEFHFSRRFKQIMGLTPSAYRRQFQRP